MLGGALRRQWALFVVRLRVTLRQFTAEKGRLLGTFIAAVFVLPANIGLAVITFYGYRTLDEPWPAQILAIILTGLWLFWVVYPVLFSPLNEGLDITRLLVYPLSRGELAFSVIAGTLVDYTTYAIIPFFLAILLGWGAGPALLIIPFALLIIYGQMVFSGQLIVTLFGGLFRTRRFRDLLILFFSLGGFACAGLNILSQGIFARNDFAFAPNFDRLADIRPLNFLQWLPPGAAARAIERASQGAWGDAMIWLSAAALWLLVIAWLWDSLHRRVIRGEGFLLGPPAGATAGAPTAARPSRPSPLNFLPPDVAALVRKELRALWRIPQRRMGLLFGSIMPVFFAGPFLIQFDLDLTIPAWGALLLPGYAIFGMWASTQNMLGLEGRGLTMLLLTPVPRERIFLAKAIALSLVSVPTLLILVGVAFWLIDNVLVIAGALLVIPSAMVTTAVTAVASARWPTPVNLESMSGNASPFTGRGGCIAVLINIFVVPPLLVVANAPILGLPVLGFFLEWTWLVWLSVPLNFVYSYILFRAALRFAGSLLLEREPEVLQTIREAIT